MRNLASLQTVSDLRPIPGADSIEVARVLGWECVVKKGEFKIGDPCVYFEIDSIVPPKPEFQFLEKSKYRIKTIRLRGQVSQGLALPVPMISYAKINGAKVGSDLTTLLGVTKYEAGVTSPGNAIPKAPKPWHVRLWHRILQALGLREASSQKWPSFLHKTDETRIQSCPAFIGRHKGEAFYITEKLDGCSCTIYLRKGKFGVCSRNFEIPRGKVYGGNDVRQHFWAVIARDGIEAKMRGLGRNLAIQGEMVGPKIQGNKYKLPIHRIYVFNVHDLDANRYLDIEDARKVAAAIGLEWCPSVGGFVMGDEHTVDKLVAMSKGKSVLGSTQREGIVVRTVKESGDTSTGRASFKVINHDFLLKYDE